ncbi:hypothetical protein FGK63_08030 [Ruegeria sediminis]|uniref:Glycosyl transferase n=1 Tax=Ruegeria sediminis TaxID=2583820 RepID=A0ABY2X298_9RHOB|nr:hypothetical protein [Ruegeria sediminis]TMV09057.1 hypothetical protein FGK63_08030 [Ruegeria sediminis]
MIYVFTTCALNYFPNARILAHSLRKYLPEARTVFCITDVPPPGFDAVEEGFDEYWTLEDLRPQIPDLEQWVFRHDVMELATAAKPFVLSALLEREDCDAVLFFDPDCELHSALPEIQKSVRDHSITLTPHSCIPHTVEPWVFFELNQLKVGAFNLGFFGVKNDEEGRTFAHWWRHRLKNYCVIDESRHLFTDQKWIDLVPSYFSSVNVLRSPTYNVARWNSFQRKITRGIEGTVLVDGQPLDFIHYSGFLKKGTYVRGLYDSKSAEWCEDLQVMDELSESYAERLAEDQARPELSAAFGFGTYDDGTPIPADHRDAFRKWPSLQRDFANPFAAGAELRKKIAQLQATAGGKPKRKSGKPRSIRDKLKKLVGTIS